VTVSTRFAARIVTWLAVLVPTTGLLADAPDESAPTAIEQALIENGCVASLPPGALDSESYRQCLRARLLSLRADFGRDLEQVTRAERQALDAACTGLRTAGREAYLDCLDAQLASLGAGRKPAPALSPSPFEQVADQSPTITGAHATHPSEPARQLWLSAAVIATTLGLMIAAVGRARFVREPRRPPSSCRECGAELTTAGDLCAPCRRQAAESRRRVQTEAQVDQGARPKEETAARSEPEREISIDPPPEAEAADHAVEPVPARVHEVLFDPYVVLGIMPDATPDEIRAAYEAARSKFDPGLVSHLSSEVQKHFKARALALDRAYQLLA
jgi:hypothetical protein